MDTITIHTLKDYVELSARNDLKDAYLVAEENCCYISGNGQDGYELGDEFPDDFEKLARAAFELLGIRVHIT
jgi:hypothetical protein